MDQIEAQERKKTVGLLTSYFGQKMTDLFFIFMPALKDVLFKMSLPKMSLPKMFQKDRFGQIRMDVAVKECCHN